MGSFEIFKTGRILLNCQRFENSRKLQKSSKNVGERELLARDCSLGLCLFQPHEVFVDKTLPIGSAEKNIIWYIS